mmetsp:Transcript_44830/g.129671  ORF Transcript_44830/g.129671 Transcript_44830/m.129671 type:complete len:361 (-) Transcript_44830:81-1163(-)
MVLRALGGCVCRLLSWLGWCCAFFTFLIALGAFIQAGTCLFVRCEWQPCLASGGMVSNTTSGLKVILPSVGQTGTTSVHSALATMGYRSFHTEDIGTYLPQVNVDATLVEEFAQLFSKCAVEAVALEPIIDTFPAVLEASPEAKVIMTWRAYDAWFKSAISAKFLKEVPWAFVQGLIAFPFKNLHMLFVADVLMGGALSRLMAEGRPFSGRSDVSALHLLIMVVYGMWNYHGEGTNVADRGVSKISGHEEAYLGHIDEIRRLAEGRLLEFDVSRHGYAELAEFLGRASPKGAQGFPHPRSKDSWTNDPMFDHNKSAYSAVLASLLAFNILSIALFRQVVLHLVAQAKRCMRSMEKEEKQA